MGQKYEKLMASMQAELDGAQPEEPKPVDTTTTEPEPDPEPEPTPDPEPAPEPEHDEPEPEPTPAPEPEKHEPEKRDIPDDPVKRAEFAFKRQLTKQKEKHDAELKERDDRLDKLMKEIEELKKSKADTPKKELRREDFKDDEDFIRALQEDAMKKAFAERDEADAKKAKEAAEAEQKRKAEEDELRQEQAAWLKNVDEAFGNDKAKSNKFLSDIQYANEHGLGEILDNCPVASDYLMHDPMGPVVFDKVIHDKATFDKVFDMRRLSPMNIFYQLKKVEEEIMNPAPAVEPAPSKPVMPHLGKPGRQAAGSSMTNNDMFSDPKAVKKWLREHR